MFYCVFLVGIGFRCTITDTYSTVTFGDGSCAYKCAWWCEASSVEVAGTCYGTAAAAVSLKMDGGISIFFG